MNRRNLVCQAPAWLLVPTFAQAQSGPRLPVVLTSGPRTSWAADPETQTRQELARLGWRVGDNLRIEIRYGDSQPERTEAAARELMAMQPAVALAWDGTALLALWRNTKQVPMVTAYSTDPVGAGVAASLRRPGGLVTGLSGQYPDIRPKLYELARQLAPSARRLAAMFDRRVIPAAQFDPAMAGLSRIAQQVGLEFLPLPVRDVGEIEAALRSLTPVREHVLLLNIDPLVYPNYGTIAALARTLRLPSGSQAHDYATAGGLFSYGPDLSAMRLRAVQMVDQVLRGQPVGEIPIEQPTRITLTLNQATAKSIGLTFPREFLLRADEMIG